MAKKLKTPGQPAGSLPFGTLTKALGEHITDYYMKIAHYELGEKSPHSLLLVATRKGKGMTTLARDWRESLAEVKLADPDEWNNSDLYEALNRRGWSFINLSIQNATDFES